MEMAVWAVWSFLRSVWSITSSPLSSRITWSCSTTGVSRNGIMSGASWWTPAWPPKTASRPTWITLELHTNQQNEEGQMAIMLSGEYFCVAGVKPRSQGSKNGMDAGFYKVCKSTFWPSGRQAVNQKRKKRSLPGNRWQSGLHNMDSSPPSLKHGL